MVSPVYQFMLIDGSTGTTLGELTTFAVTSPFTRVLNGVGTLTGTMSADDPIAADTYLGVGVSTNTDREITVLRDGVPVWNGPVTNQSANLRARQVMITASEASHYLWKRTLEQDSDLAGSALWTGVTDLFDITRALVNYGQVKDSTGTLAGGGSSINAAIPRFVVDPTSALAGVTKNLRYAGTDRHYLGDIINDLVADPTTGLDFCMGYSDDSGSTLRTLTLGSPSLGTFLASPTLTEGNLYDFDKTEDRTRAANRVHMVGSGYVDTEQNTGSIAAGDILIEARFDRGDLTDVGMITQAAKDARRRAQPPVASYVLTFSPGSKGDPTADDLDWGFCDLGDKVNLGVTGPSILHSEGHVRVVQIGVVPSSRGSRELVTLTAEIPLDSLGT